MNVQAYRQADGVTAREVAAWARDSQDDEARAIVADMEHVAYAECRSWHVARRAVSSVLDDAARSDTAPDDRDGTAIADHLTPVHHAVLIEWYRDDVESTRYVVYAAMYYGRNWASDGDPIPRLLMHAARLQLEDAVHAAISAFDRAVEEANE